MDRSSLLFVAVILILVVSSVSLSNLIEKGFIAASNELMPKVLWQSDMVTFATDFLFADGNVVVAADLLLFVYE